MATTILIKFCKNFCLTILTWNLVIDYISLSTTRYPLCGSMVDGQSLENDQIIFKDSMGVRTVVVNGTRIMCIPSTNSRTQNSNRTFSDYESDTGSGTSARPRRNHTNIPPTRFGQNSMQTNLRPTHRPLNVQFSPDPIICIDRNQNLTFCENATNYPENMIDAIISESTFNLRGSFRTDMIDSDIETRNNAAYEEVSLCDSSEELSFPLIGEREDGTDWVIVNTKKYKQGVRIERCLKAEQPCNMGVYPNSYQAVCTQHFVYRELIAVAPEGNVAKDKFKFPACCSCVLRKFS